MPVFVIGTLCLLVFLAWGTYQTAQVLDSLPPDLNPLLLPAENALRLVLIGICLVLGQVSGLSWEQLGWVTEDPLDDLGWGLAVGVLIAVTVPPLTHVAVRRFGPQVYSSTIVKSVLPRNRRQWIAVPLALVSSVVLEELLFRSLLIGGFGSLAPSMMLVGAWSVVFGLMHSPQGVLGMAVAGALGIVLSLLFLATGGLIAPVVAHYTINLLQMIWACVDKSWVEAYASSHS